MDFVYYYKTSDGIRHEAEVTAPSRDDVFAELRRQGIRPIRVVEKNPEPQKRGVGKRYVVLAVVLTALASAVVFWGIASHVKDVQPVEQTEVYAVGGVVSSATSLPRQRIVGDRYRLENAPTNLFSHVAEAFLARFAEPGRVVSNMELTAEIESDFPAALKNQIRVAKGELTEYIDLKRIVTGMKKEMSAYLAGGGTAREYVVELVKRQKMEISYRDKAAQRLEELLKVSQGKQTASSVNAQFSTAYAYWLKANASLHAMGIAPLELPNELHAYQMTLDIDDEDGLPTIEVRAIESPAVAVPAH